MSVTSSPVKSFRSQIDWLVQNVWRGLSVGEALGYPTGKSVVITFDDGTETDLIAAAPILKEAKFNATFYVTAGHVGKAGYMSSAQVRELQAHGFEIGCHSMTHAYLDDLDISVFAPRDFRFEENTGRRGRQKN